MRASVLAPISTLVLVGCMVGGPAVDGPPPRVGPTLVLQVTNRSATRIEVGYRFGVEASSGEGAGAVGGCERVHLLFGDVAGTVEVLVDGEVIDEAVVQAGVRTGTYIVLLVDIAVDGTPDVTGRRLVAEAPELQQLAIPGCG